ncbi:hypothetical protein C1645_811832 [Glomus cerebriforme]|uniref:Uncharacterized protein n=1 Tax=Glomus cerebriforme TaxID=658196 RepID=A0A397TQ98_9GLOM|nr:hypothetical protein C1645_811832 [Glomus cerebriforme]
MKAFNIAKRYREGIRDKKSLVGEKIYKEFLMLFWLKPELFFDQQHNESVRRKSRMSSSSRLSNTRISDIIDLFETSPPASRSVTPSIEIPINSRPVIPSVVE